MGNSNANKQSVCERYSGYLYIIYHFGNKVILIKQLYRYAQEFGLADSYSAFYGHIKQLINAELIRKEAFLAYGRKTQLQMLTLKNTEFGLWRGRLIVNVLRLFQRRIQMSVFSFLYSRIAIY